VDAGTGTGMNLPYPVLMKLTDPAVLPNSYQMDLADCLVIGAAVGDLPSERVFIRTETLSCLRRSGGLITIDGDLKGHVVGEDGKLGLRGRVVEKTGKIIVRSMIAGFLAGLSDAFKPRITYAPIAVGGTTDQSFQLPPMADSLQAAGITGTGRTMELLAKHYLDQMGKLYPIIEIESLRTVDIVILKGLPLTFRAQQRTPGETTETTVIE
jgi:conjugal transfer pilus assembly protein TraB